MGATFGSRRWWRAGVTAALGLGMTLLGATAAAAESAPPKDGFVVRAGGLVLTHNGQHRDHPRRRERLFRFAGALVLRDEQRDGPR